MQHICEATHITVLHSDSAKTVIGRFTEGFRLCRNPWVGPQIAHPLHRDRIIR